MTSSTHGEHTVSLETVQASSAPSPTPQIEHVMHSVASSNVLNVLCVMQDEHSVFDDTVHSAVIPSPAAHVVHAIQDS